jgi:hypothetical protein
MIKFPLKNTPDDTEEPSDGYPFSSNPLRESQGRVSFPLSTKISKAASPALIDPCKVKLPFCTITVLPQIVEIFKFTSPPCPCLQITP